MPGGFNNGILGGMSKLIRAAIQSPNYIAGLLGWTINRDGSAEFNDLTVRGRLALKLLSSASDHLSDIYWQDGLTTPGRFIEVGDTTGAQISKRLVLAGGSIDNIGGITGGNDASIVLDSYTPNDPTDPLVGSLHVLGYHDVTLDTKMYPGGIINLGGDTARIVNVGPQGGTSDLATVTVDGIIKLGRAAGTGIGPSGYTVQIGYAPPAGKAYYERVAMSAQVIASAAAFTQLVNLSSQKTYNDYAASAWDLVNGVWTCPEDGVYSLTFNNDYTAWVAGSRVIAAVFLNGVATANQIAKLDGPMSSGQTNLSVTRDFAAGDVLRFQVGQVTGAGQTLVVGSRGYIAIKRQH